MNKYAMIWTTTLGYMPGTNASLNALEYYGFKDVDVYILYLGDLKKELGEEYLSQWPDINFLEIDKSIYPIPHSIRGDYFWYCTYADIHFAIEQFSKYDAILLWNSDSCIVNNFMVYFDITSKLDKIIVATNEQGVVHLNNLSKSFPYINTGEVPYTDIPWFIPKSKVDYLKLVLEYGSREDFQLPRMTSINYAIRDQNLINDVFTVPGNLWIYNIPYILPVVPIYEKKQLYSYNERMNSFHRRYWNLTVCRQYLPGSNELTMSISKQNKMIFNRIWNFFNRECRVKWTEGIEVWDGK